MRRQRKAAVDDERRRWRGDGRRDFETAATDQDGVTTSQSHGRAGMIRLRNTSSRMAWPNARMTWIAALVLAVAARGQETTPASQAALMAGWQPGETLEGRPSCRVTTVAGRETGSEELRIAAPASLGVAIRRNVVHERDAWGRAQRLTAEVFVPAGPKSPSVELAVEHDLWGGFALHPTRLLRAGEWTPVAWTLDAGSGEWIGLEHPVAYNDAMRRQLAAVSLRFYSQGCDAPDVAGDPDRAAGGSWVVEARVRRLKLEVEATAPMDLRITQLRPVAPSLRQGELLELSFDLTIEYDNPFDPDEIAVDVDFFGPAGTSFTLPAFYSQDFVRRILDDGAETYSPRGAASWKARFTPLAPGPHHYVVRARDGAGRSCEVRSESFEVSAAAFHGFLRVDKQDMRYLCFDDGALFYPVGLIVRSPSEQRWKYNYDFEQMPADFGLSAYDDYFTSMAQNGLNHTRVWMASWWNALEWSRGYSPYYQGLGRYNLLNAWRQDYVINLAQRHGIYVNLTLHNHGQFSLSADSEWPENPYNRERGGPISQPQEFFSDAECFRHVRNRFRYIVARWGYSPHIVIWELFNEVNLVANYDSPRIRDWHREAARYLKSIDPYRRLISTHFTVHHYDPEVMGLPEIEVAQVNCYRANMIGGLRDVFGKYGSLGKPALVNEFGVGVTHPQLRHNLHAGLWGTSVMPWLGVGMFWWASYTHEKNEYLQYLAVEDFHRGEDYRGRGYEVASVKINGGGDLIGALGMRGPQSARIWIYDRRIYEKEEPGDRPGEPVARRIPEVEIQVEGLTAGRYRVEFWDAWKGGVLERREIECDGNALTAKAPAFIRDIACKIDRL